MHGATLPAPAPSRFYRTVLNNAQEGTSAIVSSSGLDTQQRVDHRYAKRATSTTPVYHL
jgi:hypothetical protein